jgi:uncharacterized protein (DUF58 family)
MGQHLHRATAHFGTDTRGLLDGGRYALVHTRSLELDELRPYVPGDDVRDIDWKATARSSEVLVKRFVSEKHHKILLVADAGRNVAALTPSGECKRDVTTNILGAIGLIAMRRSDEIGLVYGDARGSVTVPGRRGESHVESLLERYYGHSGRADAGTSDITAQLGHVARSHRTRLLLIVVSDEPDVTPALDAELRRLSGRHEVMWLLVQDMPAIGAGDDTTGFDVVTGRFVLAPAVLGARVLHAYQAAEERRRADLEAFLAGTGVRYARIGASTEIRPQLTRLSEMYRHAG